MDADLAFACRIYDRRPAHCRDYPWRDAQLLLDECVYVESGRVLGREAAEARFGGAQAVDDACRSCGRCCLAWLGGKDRRPVARCTHLDIAASGPAGSARRRALMKLSPVEF